MTGAADPGYAAEMDAADELASFRERFVIEQGGPLYMDGNSLGRLPKATAGGVGDFITDEWGRDLVRGWSRWIDLCAEIGDLIALRLVGAAPGEVIVSDSTSVNLYKLAASALDLKPERSRIITDAANFPTDRYVLQGLAEQRGKKLDLLEFDPIDGPTAADLAPALDDDVAIVSFSHVDYRSGAIADMMAITDAVHRVGGLVIWDLCHSAGAVPVDLNDCDVDLAVGCTYKYLNAGPGAPAFLYVRGDLVDRLVQPIWGWFGHAAQFTMERDYLPAAGIRRFLVGTPSLLSIKGVETGVALMAEAGIGRFRAKSIALTEMIVALCEAWLAPLGFSLGSPRDPARRGSHVALRHPEAWRICRALIEKQNVIPDFREPDVIRFGVAPIYTSFTETWEAMDRLRQVVEQRTFEQFPAERNRIT